jgi:Mg2+ and Co2+ transporter CorA
MDAFTIVSFVLVPPAIIGGFFGMNVPVPMQWEWEDRMVPFYMLMGIITVLSTILYFIIKWLIGKDVALTEEDSEGSVPNSP